MKTKEEIIELEKGKILNEMSLDMIIGGGIEPTNQGGSEDCDHCNTCGTTNYSKNDEIEGGFIF